MGCYSKTDLSSVKIEALNQNHNILQNCDLFMKPGFLQNIKKKNFNWSVLCINCILLKHFRSFSMDEEKPRPQKANTTITTDTET